MGMTKIWYLEQYIARLATEIESCEDEDRWIDLCMDKADAEEELRFAWADDEAEVMGWN